MKFTKNTFKYFELAKKNKNKREWFEKNRAFYDDNVKQPMSELILEIGKKYHRELPRIDITSSKVTRPVRAKNKVDENGIIKQNSYFSLSEKQTSMFEWNPGIYFQIGTEKDDNFFGLGLYMTSSRQTSLLRNALVEDFDRIDEILTDSKLKKSWGGLKGETYKRFPKGYNPESQAAKYLQYKQFYLGKSYSKKDILDPKFGSKLVKDLGAAIDFFVWIRKTVGTYRR